MTIYPLLMFVGGILFLVLWAIRAIVLEYWRVNEIVALLREIRDRLPAPPIPPPKLRPAVVRCPSCKAVFPAGEDERAWCPRCGQHVAID